MRVGEDVHSKIATCLGNLAGAMKEEQFNSIVFHLRAMLGLICLQAGILVGFAWKYL
jgi:hypothetical protein